MRLHSKLGIDVRINEMPNEIPDAIRFSEDQVHASYDAEFAQRFWRILARSAQVFGRFRTSFIGKCSPVHFFWGSFDLAVTCFSGRRAPPFAASTSIPNMPAAVVLDAYAAFAPEMAKIARRFFERAWIDAPVRQGKSPGAFSHATVPSVHPYILLNYQGKARDVMTLAHELGHGVHQVLAAPLGPLLAPTPLTLAETASVFGETVTFGRLLTETRRT